MTTTSLDKAKIKILLLEGVHQSAVDSFREDGYTNIDYHPKSLAEPDLFAAAADAHFIGIRSATHLTSAFFERADAPGRRWLFLHRDQPGRPRSRAGSWDSRV